MFLKRRVKKEETAIPSEKLIDELVEKSAPKLYDNPSCIISTHTVSNTTELTSFISGYIASTAKVPTFEVKRPETEENFRSYLAGFYVGTLQNA